jgi:hypothetical protein
VNTRIVRNRLTALIFSREQSTPDWTPRNDLPAGKGRATDVADFAGTHEIVECAQCLVDGDLGVRAMDLIEIQAVGLQRAQAGFGLLNDITAGNAPIIDGIVTHRKMRL